MSGMASSPGAQCIEFFAGEMAITMSLRMRGYTATPYEIKLHRNHGICFVSPGLPPQKQFAALFVFFDVAVC